MAKKLPPFVEKYAGFDKELYDNVQNIAQTAFKEEGLDKKTGLLVAMAIDAVKGSSTGVASLSNQARDAGATDEEIRQVLRIAYYVAGMQTLSAGSAAFEE